MGTVLRPDKRAFPVEPPPDLVAPQVIAAHDWSAFQALPRMADHWDRPGWEGGRAFYWMLTFPKELELIEEALACQAAIPAEGFDLVPAEGLHITMCKVADVAQMDRGRLQGLVAVAAERVPAAFEVQVGPLTGSSGALRYSVAPWEPLVELHAVLAQANAPEDGSTASFRPHLGIAYNAQPRPTAPVVEWVAALRERPPVLVTVSRVELVELRRQDSVYRWEVIASLPLAEAGTGEPTPASAVPVR
ncbi:2'-5' RNA ligase family protein [Streptosporangium sp. CA-115845]|uniref:2'-5' RNA ligase family protein n=1 Tax=Streptosporangium sp. CA-115845 TaxID=3240071 RepID=UPI003D90F344